MPAKRSRSRLCNSAVTQRKPLFGTTATSRDIRYCLRYALGSAAIILGHAGQTSQAIEYGERALRVSPLDPEIHHPYIGLGIAHCAAGNWQEAIVACRMAAQANPRFSLPHVLQAAALCRLGRLDEAKSAARRVLECEPGFTVSGFVRAHTGRADIWQPVGEALRQIGLPE